MEPLSEAELKALRAWPTPVIDDAIKTFDVRPENQGYMLGIKCIFPDIGPMVGYACTAAMIADLPPTEKSTSATYAHWDNMLRTPRPRVAVIHDLDQPQCIGSVWGEVAANIHKALGCVGVVTDGGVRDLDEVYALGFHFFAADVIAGDAYGHIVDVGGPIKVGGLVVNNDDLIHADKHGVVVIPHEIAREVPEACRRVQEEERRITNFCKSTDFSVEVLKEMVKGIF